MRKYVTIAAAFCLFTVFTFQLTPAVSKQKSSTSDNNWSTWTQVKKLSY